MKGVIVPQGAKNEALQVICATVLTSDKVTIENVPNIRDVNKLIEILQLIGVKVEHPLPDTYIFQADNIDLARLDSDDFCTAASYSIKTATLINGVQEQIDRVLAGKSDQPFNVRTMMENAIHGSWISMTDKEKEAFYDRYLLRLKMTVAQDGAVSVTISG